MSLLKASFIYKTVIFLVAALFSLTVLASDFIQTQRLANQGDASAQYELCGMYANGIGVRQDHAKALECYEKSANQGYADSQLFLGMLYALGAGVPKDYIKTRQWYEKAANQGNTEAQCFL